MQKRSRARTAKRISSRDNQAAERRTTLMATPHPERVAKPTGISAAPVHAASSVSRTPSVAPKMPTPGIEGRVRASAPASPPVASAGTLVKRGVAAFTRAVPFILIEYSIFLWLVETSPLLTVVAGILFLILALGILAGLRMQSGFLPSEAQWQSIERWLGQRQDLLISILLIGIGLIAWFSWKQNGNMLFSLLSIFLLLSALFFVLRAHYRIPTPAPSEQKSELHAHEPDSSRPSLESPS